MKIKRNRFDNRCMTPRNERKPHLALIAGLWRVSPKPPRGVFQPFPPKAVDDGVLLGQPTQHQTLWGEKMTFAEWCVANVVTIKKQLQSELKQERATYKRKTSEVGVAMKCHCGALYTTSETELRRGWGLSCSRACSARRARRGLPAGRRVV